MNSGEWVLITGGCGYIGSHVTRLLSENGFRVLVYDNLSTGFAQSLIHNEKLVVGDLGDRERLEAVFKEHQIAQVLHFAASIVVPESVEHPLQYYRNNTVNTINLLELCVKYQTKKLVFSSTAAVYGDTEELLVSEQSPCRPTNPYASSKLMDEQILGDVGIAHPETKFVVLRYFNVAGADFQARMGQRFPNATHLIKVACETALGKRNKMFLYGDDYPTRDGTAIRDYIHVEDLAKAHLLALKYLIDDGESVTLNCGYGRGFTVKEVLDSTAKVHEAPIPYETVARRKGDIATIVADATKLKSLLKWSPEYDNLDLIISSAYQWEKKLKAMAR